MQIKIGGFAAFMIALVIAGTVETVCTTAIGAGNCKKVKNKRIKLWKDFATFRDEERKNKPDISGEELRTYVRSAMSISVTDMLMALDNEDEREDFKLLFEARINALV